MPLHGLTARLGERTLVPTLQSVQIGKTTDALQLRIVTGQCLTDWHKQADGLAAAWRADRITIRSIAPGEVRITLMRGDVLADPVDLPMPTSTAAVDLRAVRIGITENRHWWHVPLLGHHMLIAGATGAGKGSVLWSLIAGIAPEVKTGFVRLCVIDPKGGMERGAGAPMFTVFTHDATDTTVHMLRQLVTVMHARANRLRGHTRHITSKSRRYSTTMTALRGHRATWTREQRLKCTAHQHGFGFNSTDDNDLVVWDFDRAGLTSLGDRTLVSSAALRRTETRRIGLMEVRGRARNQRRDSPGGSGG